MAMTEGVGAGLAMAAWLVAAALALGAGGVLYGVAAHLRSRRAEERLRALEGAVSDFCSALRARLAAERVRGSGCAAAPEPRRQRVA